MIPHQHFNVSRFILNLLLILIILAPTAALSADNAEKAEEFGIKERPVRKETVFDLIFGSAPSMPTERGILVIDAFEDLNNNGLRDTDEPELRKEINCKIDKIDYIIPAFIPGLDYNNRYKIRCSGKNYYPTIPDKEILIERRGDVIELDLPCRKNSQDPPVNKG